MIADDQPWMIVQDRADIFHKPKGFVFCDRRQHLFVIHYPVNRSISVSSASSISSINESPKISNQRSTNAIDTQTVIYLERIHYIQRGDGRHCRRSAKSHNRCRLNRQNKQNDLYEPQRKRLEVFYSTDYPRSEYLYKRISFQVIKPENEFDKWLNALYAVIREAKDLDEARRRNRWLLREYEKLKRSSGGLTFDSINGWLNSHIGLVSEKTNVENIIKQHQKFRDSNEITDSVFIATYDYFVNKQQNTLIKHHIMSDLIKDEQILLEEFAARVTNNLKKNLKSDDIEHIRKSLKLSKDQNKISLQHCIQYLWSESNSAFDPISRTEIHQDMNHPLNHYWISSSHNTYLAKTQLFNPASVHCYIQALLKGCRCVEIDVMDNRSSGEPEITHKNTRIKPIPLRDVLLAIHDYAFVASEYPVIISIENHCSTVQRNIMADMFIEIFGENLIQSPLSPNETSLPSPNQLKRKIILKDAKMNNTLTIATQSSVDSDDLLDIPSPGTEGHVQLYDFAKKAWLHYNFSFKDSDLYLAQDDEKKMHQSSDDEEDDEKELKDELTQIWYHRMMPHQEAERLLLSNAGYEPGTFLVRKSLSKNCYCITLLTSDFVVKSIEISESQNEDGKRFYSLSSKKFESIAELVAHYRTYDFAEIVRDSRETVLHRLSKPIPRATWLQELEKQQWYQPKITRAQAEELLLAIGEEMTFLIRESSSRAQQDYTISVYTQALSSHSGENSFVHHCPIFRDGSDFMLMSLTFTSLVELVDYFSRKPIFKKLCLQKPAKNYATFIEERKHYQEKGIAKIIFKPLNHDISLKIDTLRTLICNENQEDRTIEVQLYVYEEDKQNRQEGYFLKFNPVKEWDKFVSKIPNGSSPSSLHRDEMTGSTTSVASSSIKTTGTSTFYDQTQVTELNKLIIYCQGVKLKDYNINKTQDLEKIRSFKEMISLNFVKASLFCAELGLMILFNQSHFTRIYPDFSRRSWSSFNFEPVPYWTAGCQMVALNFQMPDRPMHINAGRFAANGGCGYVLMPNYILSYNGDLSLESKILKFRVIGVRHLRTNYAKSILKVQVKATIISKQKSTDNSSCSTIINIPCGSSDSKYSSKHDQSHECYKLPVENTCVDLLYIEVWADNDGFCGQSAIPISSLRTGVRSIQLYDKFNERLDMSAILVDLNFGNGIFIHQYMF